MRLKRARRAHHPAQISRYSRDNSDIYIHLDNKQFDWKHELISLLSENSSNIQRYLDCLNNTVTRFGVCFATSKSKILLQNFSRSRENLPFAGEELGESRFVGKEVKLDNCLYDDVPVIIQRKRLEFTNLQYVRHLRDNPLSTRGCVY